MSLRQPLCQSSEAATVTITPFTRGKPRNRGFGDAHIVVQLRAGARIPAQTAWLQSGHTRELLHAGEHSHEPLEARTECWPPPRRADPQETASDRGPALCQARGQALSHGVPISSHRPCLTHCPVLTLSPSWDSDKSQQQPSGYSQVQTASAFHSSEPLLWGPCCGILGRVFPDRKRRVDRRR